MQQQIPVPDLISQDLINVALVIFVFLLCCGVVTLLFRTDDLIQRIKDLEKQHEDADGKDKN